MRKRFGFAYVVLVHAILILMLAKSDFLPRVERRLGFRSPPEITDYFRHMLRMHELTDGTVSSRAVVFIGSSHVQGLFTDAVATPSVNYGIGGDTTVGVLSRIPKYRSLQRAAAVVLAVGSNDLRRRGNAEIRANYERIFQALPPRLPIVVSALFPVDPDAFPEPSPGLSNERIRELNRALEGLCTADPRCVFVDVGEKLAEPTGTLSRTKHSGDGRHLNPEGYAIWIEGLRSALLKAQEAKAPKPDER